MSTLAPVSVKSYGLTDRRGSVSQPSHSGTHSVIQLTASDHFPRKAPRRAQELAFWGAAHADGDRVTCSDQGRVGPEEGVGTSRSLPQDTEQEALQCCPHKPSDLTPDVLCVAGGQPTGSQSSRALGGRSQGSGVTAGAPSPFTRGLGAGSAGVSSRARGAPVDPGSLCPPPRHSHPPGAAGG